MATKSRTCPECGARFRYEDAGRHPTFPFCGERCKLIDLGRWLKGEYQIVEDLKQGKEQIADDDPDDDRS